MTTTLDHVRALVHSARALFRGGPIGERLRDAAARLDEPLRVAIAGKVKTGESTVLYLTVPRSELE